MLCVHPVLYRTAYSFTGATCQGNRGTQISLQAWRGAILIGRPTEIGLNIWSLKSGSFSFERCAQISCDCWASILVCSPVCHHPFLKLTLAPLSNRCKQEPWRCNCDFSAPCTWSARTMITQVWTLTSKHLISFADISHKWGSEPVCHLSFPSTTRCNLRRRGPQ